MKDLFSPCFDCQKWSNKILFLYNLSLPGSFATASCLNCKAKVTADAVKEDIFQQVRFLGPCLDGKGPMKLPLSELGTQVLPETVNRVFLKFYMELGAFKGQKLAELNFFYLGKKLKHSFKK